MAAARTQFRSCHDRIQRGHLGGLHLRFEVALRNCIGATMNEALSKDEKAAMAVAYLEGLRQQHDLVEDHAALGSAAAKGALAYLRRVSHPRFEEFMEELRAEGVPNVEGLLKAVDRHEQDARKKRRARATTTAP